VTAAHKADWCCLVARTEENEPARRAMSLFVIELRGNPGIRIERSTTANGWTLGEIHFDGARVPRDSLLGQRGRGFAQMAAALQAERSGMFYLGWAERSLDALAEACRARKGVLPRALERSRIAQLQCELDIATNFAKRVIWRQQQGSLAAHEAAMAKLYATELLQRIALARCELVGAEAAAARLPEAFAGRFAFEVLERAHATIGAGTSEIQRNTIAVSGLGLPRV
jgi:alkylation response protein AidB-like acyl-CoA dehydrogenase